MYLIVIGMAVFFNIAIIIFKLNRNRVPEAVLDGILLAGVMYLFKGSFNALVVGTVASALVSIYLLIFRPKFIEGLDL